MSKNMSEQEFLFLCAKSDDEARVREALERQPELVQCRDTRDYWDKYTPLHHASFNSRERVVRLLLEHGADVHAQDKNDRPPVHAACASGCVEVARALIEHGAEVNVQDVFGLTPLHEAANRNNEVMVRLLLEHGADRSIKNSSGKTARDVAWFINRHEVVVLLDTYFPVVLMVVQVLLGMRGPSDSPLTRFATHSTFEPKVLLLVKCLLTGEESTVFEQLQSEV